LIHFLTNMPLEYAHRVHLRKGLLKQKIFNLAGMANIDVDAITARIDPYRRSVKGVKALAHRLRLQKYKELAKLKSPTDESGHLISVALKNKGGVIKSWVLPVSKNCAKVASYMFTVNKLAILALQQGGFIKTEFLTESRIKHRLEDLHAEWRFQGQTLLETTVGEQFCKKGGKYTLHINSQKIDSFLRTSSLG